MWNNQLKLSHNFWANVNEKDDVKGVKHGIKMCLNYQYKEKKVKDNVIRSVIVL